MQKAGNWTAKPTKVKENAGKSSQILPSEDACKPKSLDVALDIAGILFLLHMSRL